MSLELRTKRSVLDVGVVYMTVSIGCAGENLIKMKEVATFVRGLPIPWVLMGDFNFDIELIELCGFLKLTRGRAISPAGVSFTCSQGKGTLIDYVVASENLAPYLRVSSMLNQFLRRTHVFRLTCQMRFFCKICL